MKINSDATGLFLFRRDDQFWRPEEWKYEEIDRLKSSHCFSKRIEDNKNS